MFNSNIFNIKSNILKYKKDEFHLITRNTSSRSKIHTKRLKLFYSGFHGLLKHRILFLEIYNFSLKIEDC